jgi:hypothetical protein
MPKRTSNNAQTVTAWWLGEGDELCSHCGHTYILELEFRCTECDGPSCPNCKVVHAKEHLICPTCAPDHPTRHKNSHDGGRRG